jgi:triosephosphate isomerase
MRKQIAAANWKMNKTIQEAETLLDEILCSSVDVKDTQEVLFAVPFPFLTESIKQTNEKKGYHVAAQNCHHKKSGAYTGEVSVDMLDSIGVRYCIVGHSERREYAVETNAMLAEKTDLCLSKGITPVFCCGEALSIREAGTQNEYVGTQIRESLFHLDAKQVSSIVVAYEPIWAIGTGKTASAEQAQEMHAHIRSVFADQYGLDTAESISILYGGSVKGSNAAEIFSQPDVDGGLVGGASLIPDEFIQIIKSLK